MRRRVLILSFCFETKLELREPVKPQFKTILSINITNIELHSNTVRGNSLLFYDYMFHDYLASEYN